MNIILENINNLIEELVSTFRRRQQLRKRNPFGRGNPKAIAWSAAQQKRKIDKVAVAKMTNSKQAQRQKIIRQQNIQKAKRSA
ncbi:MAG: hypothetical protein H8D97_01075 [Proteobacteria bacterium]|nr:hypothetical protein [Pseudomonadota bacterium]